MTYQGTMTSIIVFFIRNKGGRKTIVSYFSSADRKINVSLESQIIEISNNESNGGQVMKYINFPSRVNYNTRQDTHKTKTRKRKSNYLKSVEYEKTFLWHGISETQRESFSPPRESENRVQNCKSVWEVRVAGDAREGYCRGSNPKIFIGTKSRMDLG